MNICDYGCEQEGKFYFKTVKKWCCHKVYTACPFQRKLQSIKFKQKLLDPTNKYSTLEHRQKLSESMKKRWQKEGGCYRNKDFLSKLIYTAKNQWNDIEKRKVMSLKIKDHWKKGTYGQEWSKKQSSKQKMSIEKIKERYPFFCKVEDILESNEIGKFFVHCKNSNCKNSKEKGGWFLASYSQIYERIRSLENNLDYNFLYCCEECKKTCIIYNKKFTYFLDDNSEKNYTLKEYQTFRNFVLERDNYICQFCGEKAEHVHHERPQKLEPFFSLDPDYAWSCCKKCHYEKGHDKDSNCSIGKISSKIC